jgi:hypothetical protein
MFTLVLLDGILGGFSKFRLFVVDKLHFNLAFLGSFQKLYSMR